MKDIQFVIVDWTRKPARAGVFTRGSGGLRLKKESIIQTSIAIRCESGTLEILFGDEAEDLQEDSRTLVFQHPELALPRIEDRELQAQLIMGFWRALEQKLMRDGLLEAGSEAVGYLIVPHNFPPSILDIVRENCSGERSVKLIGIAHSAAALVLGFLRLEQVSTVTDSLANPATTCLVVAHEESLVEVVCFDQSLTAARLNITIRDFFQTTSREFSARLRDCDWLGIFTRTVLIADEKLPAKSHAMIATPLSAVTDGMQPQEVLWPGSSHVKLMGGAYLAACASRLVNDSQECSISHTLKVGVQIGKEFFHSIIPSNNRDACIAAQAFKLQGRIGNTLRLSFWCGYSTRVSDATPLGNALLTRSDLNELTHSSSLGVVVQLDSPGSGEFLVGIMPENRMVRRLPFRLPPLMM